MQPQRGGLTETTFASIEFYRLTVNGKHSCVLQDGAAGFGGREDLQSTSLVLFENDVGPFVDSGCNRSRRVGDMVAAASGLLCNFNNLRKGVEQNWPI